MSKLEKRKQRILSKIQFLENELHHSLSDKTSTSREIDISKYAERISALKKELSELK